jgi:hypothetical protein
MVDTLAQLLGAVIDAHINKGTQPAIDFAPI